MKNMFLNAAVAVCCVALALAPVRAEPSRSEPKRLSCLSGTNLIVNGTFESGEFSPWTRNATKGNAAYVNLFVESEATLRLAGGEVKLAQQTAYPWKGGVRIEVTPGRAGSPLPAAAVAGRPPYRRFALHIRVPGWCVGRPVPSDLYEQVVPGTLDDFRVTVNGAVVKVVPVKGYCVIDRAWKAGDVVEVAMNMPVRRVKANDKVAADRGRAAVERGPIVFCSEGIDNGGKVLDACLPLNTTFTESEIEIASTRMVSLTGGGLTLVPYFAWCHRGAGEMQTWFAESTEATEFCIRLKCRPKRSAGLAVYGPRFGRYPLGPVVSW